MSSMNEDGPHDDGSHTPSGARTPSSKLDTLPREDLVKFVKKQLIVLNKSKARCQELSKEVEALKIIQGDGADSATQLKELESEKNELLAAYNAVQLGQEQSLNQIDDLDKSLQKTTTDNSHLNEQLQSLTKEHKVLQEQIDCMKMKDETMTSSFQFMQADFDATKAQNKDLQDQVKILTEARDQVLESMKTLKQNYAQKAEGTETENNRKIEELSQQLEQVKDEHEQLVQDLEESRAKHRDDVRLTKLENEEMALKLLQMKEMQTTMLQENERCQENEYETKKLCDAVKKEKNELNTLLQNMKQEKLLVDEQLKSLVQEKTLADENRTKLSDELSLAKTEVADLNMQISKSADSGVQEESNLKDELVELKMKYTQVNEEKSNIEKANKEFCDEIANLGEIVNRLKDELCKEKEQTSTLQESISSLQNEKLDEEKTQNESSNNEILSLKEQITSLQSEKDSCENQLEKLNVENTTLTEHTETKMRELLAITDEHSKLEESFQTINTDYSELKQKHSQIESAFADSEAENSTLAEENSKLTMDISTIQATLNDMKAEHEGLKTGSSDLCKAQEEKIGTLGEELHSIADEKNILSQKLEEALHERDTLREDMQNSMAETGSAPHNVAHLQHTVDELQFITEELKEKLKTCSTESDQQKQELSVLSAENEALTSQVQTLKETLMTSQEECNKLGEELDNLKKEKLELLERLQNSEENAQANSQVHQQIETYIVQIEELKRDVDISRAEAETHRKSRDESRAQIDSFAPERDMLQAKIHDLSTIRRQHEASQEENSRLLAQIQSLQEGASVNDTLQDEITHLKAREIELIREFENKIEICEIKLSEFTEISEKTITKLTENEQQFAPKFAQLFEEYNTNKAQSEAEIERLNNELQETKTSMVEKENELEQLKPEICDLEKKLAEQTNMDDILRTENTEYVSKIETLEHSIVEVNKTLDSTKQDLLQSQDEYTQLKNECGNLKVALESLKDGANSNTEEAVSLNEENVGLKSENDTLNSQLQTVQSESNMLKEQIQNDQSQKVKLESEKDFLSQHLEDNKSQVERLQHQLSSAHSERDSLQIDVQKIQSEFTSSQNDISILKANHEETKTQYDQMCAEKVNLETELDKSRDTMSQLTSELERTNQELVEVKTQASTEIAEIREKYAAEGTEETAQLMEELSTLRKDKDAIETKFKAGLQKFKTLKQDNGANEEAIKQIHVELDEKQSQLQEKELQLQENISQLQERELQLQEKDTKFNEIQTLKDTKDSENEDLKAELAQLKDTNNSLSEDKLNIQENCNKLEAECEEIRSQLANFKDKEEEFSQETVKLKEELSERDNTIAQLSSQINALANTNADLINLSSEIEHLKKIVHVKQTEISDSESAMEEKESEISELQSSIQIVNAEKESIEKELKNMNAQLEAKSEIIANNEDLITSLTSELEDANKSVSDHAQMTPEVTQQSENNVEEQTLEKCAEHPATDGDWASKVASLEAQVKEKDSRESKFKQLTLKAKKESSDLKAKNTSLEKELKAHEQRVFELEKELTSLKHQAQTNQQASSTHVHNYQSLQNECDRIQNTLDDELKRRKRAESDLKQNIEEMTALKIELEEFKDERSRLVAQVGVLESGQQDLESARAALETDSKAVVIQLSQLGTDKSDLLSQLLVKDNEIESLTALHHVEIEKLKRELHDLTASAQIAKKDAQHSNMMNLEIADYERTIQSLNDQISARDNSIEELNTEINRLGEKAQGLQKRLDTSESQYLQAEDRGNKLKQLLVQTKKDLADSKKREGEQRTSDVQLRAEMELLTQQFEEEKIQISGLVAENQKLTDKIRSLNDTNQRSSRSLEVKVQSLHDDLDAKSKDYETVLADYEGYKVRVHNVLKQQKTRTHDELSLEQEKQARTRAEKALENAKDKLFETTSALEQSRSECFDLQDEYDRLQQRHSKLVADLDNKEKHWRDKLEKLQSEKTDKSSEHVETIKSLHMQIQTMNETYKEQMRLMQEDHSREVNTLHMKLNQAESDLYTLERQLQQANHSSTHNGNHGDATKELHVVTETVHDPRKTERQSGEGMDHTELEACQRTQSPGPNILPFERLLSSATDDTASEKTIESVNESVLQDKLFSAERRIQHVNGLLNEAEAQGMRLTEQAKILKDEIRRLERNQERDKGISNMEYLKNIIIKFLTLRSEDERQQLIPVITTMLKLSPDEKQILLTIARGGDDAPSQEAGPGWGSYLHRWSGLS